MGVSPDLWGPSTWTFLHLAVLSEPENFDKNRLVFYKQLYLLLQELLPCQICRIHLKENMAALKSIDTLKTKRELFDWTTDLHNRVNKRNNKSTYSYADAFNLWNDIANEKRPLHRHPSVLWKYLSILLLIAILVYVIYRIVKKRADLAKK